MEEKDKKIIIYICAGCIGIILILVVIGALFGATTPEDIIKSATSPPTSLPTSPTTTPLTTRATPIPTTIPTPRTTPTTHYTSSSVTSGQVCDCSSDLYNCDDLGLKAQDCFDYCKSIGKGDVHNLDRDGDGIVCEK